jgi:hypothetical protein
LVAPGIALWRETERCALDTASEIGGRNSSCLFRGAIPRTASGAKLCLNENLL